MVVFLLHTHSRPFCVTLNVSRVALNYALIHTSVSFDLTHTHTHVEESHYALRLECLDGIIAVTSEEKETEGGGMERGMIEKRGEC